MHCESAKSNRLLYYVYSTYVHVHRRKSAAVISSRMATAVYTRNSSNQALVRQERLQMVRGARAEHGEKKKQASFQGRWSILLIISDKLDGDNIWYIFLHCNRVYPPYNTKYSNSNRANTRSPYWSKSRGPFLARLRGPHSPLTATTTTTTTRFTQNAAAARPWCGSVGRLLTRKNIRPACGAVPLSLYISARKKKTPTAIEQYPPFDSWLQQQSITLEGTRSWAQTGRCYLLQPALR